MDEIGLVTALLDLAPKYHFSSVNTQTDQSEQDMLLVTVSYNKGNVRHVRSNETMTMLLMMK